MDDKQFRSWLIGFLEDKTVLNEEQLMMIEQKTDLLPRDKDGNVINSNGPSW